MTDAIEVVRHPRARRARLSVDPATGRIRLTVPRAMPLRTAREWAAGQGEWIARQRALLPAPVPFVPGAAIPFADRTVMLEWDPALPRTPRLTDARLACGGPIDGFAGRIERWLRRAALDQMTLDTDRYAERAGVAVTHVAVGDPRGRWGSCSSSGAIRYSWRLILAPGHVRRSTAAHEVAHRIHMHHGPAFHALVAELADDDPDAARAWLRTHGAGLHWYGRASSG